MDYPVWVVGGLGSGWVIGIVAIVHVVVSHFAIGGGGLMVLAETVGHRAGNEALVRFARRHAFVLVAVSSIFGALTGVGIWFSIGLVHPKATAALIHNFVWGWAIEWTFFVVEIATALVYWQTWDRVSRRTHQAIGWIYFVAAYLSLVVINGIVAFMLTPGRWLESGSFWDAFFNPTYFPGLVLRTGVAAMIAGVVALVLGSLEREPAGRRAVNGLGSLVLVLGSVVTLAGILWWRGALPEEARDAFGRGGYVQGTYRLLLGAVGASLVLGLGGLLARRGRILPLAILGILSASVTLGAFERVREASRRPYVIHGYMYSNGILASDVEAFQEEGFPREGWPAAAPRLGKSWGEVLYESQCASCHTLNGYRSLRRLTEGFEAEDLEGALEMLPDLHPRMPPFAGNAADREALARFLHDLNAE
jgi:cytochrome bd-type quinol oxidase subunit 1